METGLQTGTLHVPYIDREMLIARLCVCIFNVVKPLLHRPNITSLAFGIHTVGPKHGRQSK